MSFMQKLKDVILNTNPDIDGDMFRFNCQRVVVAAEARWRGKNVVAKDRLFTRGNGSAHESIAMEQAKYGWTNCFRDKNGTEGRKLVEIISCNNNKEYYNEISKRMKKYGDGSRAIISRGGHVYSCVQNGDETVFYDAQVKKRHKKQSLIDENNYIDFQEKDDGTIHLLRVDNLEFTENALVAITEG